MLFNVYFFEVIFYILFVPITLSFPFQPYFLAPPPFSYALEGLNMTQFYQDTTPVTTTTGVVMTAEAYINSFYTDWHYSNVGYDVMALLIFIVALR